MPICNRCTANFDVEHAPGALMFGHPSTVKEAVPVWKAHICQLCEEEMVMDWELPPKGYGEEPEQEQDDGNERVDCSRLEELKYRAKMWKKCPDCGATLELNSSDERLYACPDSCGSFSADFLQGYRAAEFTANKEKQHG